MKSVLAIILFFCLLSFSDYNICHAQNVPNVSTRVKKQADKMLLRDYARIGDEQSVETLLRNGANVNGEDSFDWKPIHEATRYGRKTVVEILLRNGAEINIENKDKWTPLHEAVYRDHEQIVDLLLSEGASIYAKTIEGKTALDIAVEKGNGKIIKLLLKMPSQRVVDRILNGQEVELGEFSWMAALGYINVDDDFKTTFDCGGTIISEWFVLTAAHCVLESREPVLVRMGIIAMDDSDRARTLNVPIEKIYEHPNYSVLTRKNDIALIRLRREIQFTEFVSPACLQTDLRDENPNVELITTGWGSISAKRIERSNKLLKTQLRTMPLNECNTTLLEYNQQAKLAAFRGGINESQYCAYDPQGRKDSCQGDSGGPLQYFADANSSIATVFGIVSFGISCGSTLPGIYTRVAYYLDWIESIVWIKQ